MEELRERARAAERDQARRVDEARAAERARIAREMHDTLAHRLTLLATTAGALEYRTDLSPEQVSTAAGVVRASAGDALEELRTVIGVLRERPDGLRPMPGYSRTWRGWWSRSAPPVPSSGWTPPSSTCPVRWDSRSTGPARKD